MKAIEAVDFEAAETALSSGARPTADLLKQAILKRSMPLFRKLVASCVNVDERDSRGYTPLATALREQSDEAIEVLLQAGASPDLDVGLNTPLTYAASNGMTRAATLLIQAGADLEKVDSGNSQATPLFLAAKFGHADIVKQLLEAGANRNAKDRYGATPLEIAISMKRPEAAQVLSPGAYATSMAEFNEPDQLGEAIEKGDVAAVADLLGNGADVNAPDSHGHFPLQRAIRSAPVAVVEQLIKAGAELNKASGVDSIPPLQMAIERKRADVVKALLRGGAKVKTKSRKFQPLYSAAQSGSAEIVRMILEAGADVDSTSSSGTTPLIAGIQVRAAEVVRLLIEAGADPNQADNNGWTPLIWAIMSVHEPKPTISIKTPEDAKRAMAIADEPPVESEAGVEVIQYLVSRGADTNAQDRNGRKASSYASSERIRQMLGEAATPSN